MDDNCSFDQREILLGPPFNAGHATHKLGNSNVFYIYNKMRSPVDFKRRKTSSFDRVLYLGGAVASWLVR